MIVQLFVKHLRHVVVHRSHYLIHAFDESDFFAGFDEVFSHFKTDKPSAHNYDLVNAVRGYTVFEADDVGNIAYSENIASIYAADGLGEHRGSSRRKNKLIVGFFINFTGLQIFYGNFFSVPVYGYNFAFGENVYIMFCFKLLRIHHDQVSAVFNDAAEIIRQRTV